MSTSTTTYRSTLLLFGIAALLTGPVAGSAQPPTQTPPPVPREFDVPDDAAVPDDLQLVIIREDLIPGQFRIVDVRLNRSVDEGVLATLAGLLRDSDERMYQRTYIVYYLPGMEAGAGGWATSHFTPDLEVRVLEP